MGGVEEGKHEAHAWMSYTNGRTLMYSHRAASKLSGGKKMKNVFGILKWWGSKKSAIVILALFSFLELCTQSAV